MAIKLEMKMLNDKIITRRQYITVESLKGTVCDTNRFDLVFTITAV